jgi:hypothetical protein
MTFTFTRLSFPSRTTVSSARLSMPHAVELGGEGRQAVHRAAVDRDDEVAQVRCAG